jgi:tetratricopeptide (TPR) repeat protein
MSAAQAVIIGNGLIQDRDFHSALTYFQEAQKHQPTPAEALIGLAECYYELQRDDQALAIYQSLTEPQANVWKVQFNLGRIYLESGRFEESVAAFTKAVALKQNDPDTLRNLGVALTKLGRASDALGYLTQVMALNRFEPDDAYALGEAYANLRDWGQAAAAFKTGADRKSIDPDAFSRWGKMLYHADKLDQALEAFKKAKMLNIQHLEASYYMADIYRRLGNSIDALGHYSNVLRQKRDDVQVLVQAAYLSFKLGLMGEAEQHYKTLKTLDPNNAALTNLAALESVDNEKKVDNGAPTPGVTLREVVGANPNHGESHINLGAQLITEGIYAEAVTELQKGVSLLPNSAAAHFNLGLAQLKVGDFQNAVASNQRALQLKPEWSAAYNNLGQALAGVNKWTEATQAYLEAIRLTPQYAGATYNLGRAYLALGRKDLAQPLIEILKKSEGFDLRARLANAIGGVEPGATPAVAAAKPETSTSAPQPTPTLSPSVSEPIAAPSIAVQPTATPSPSVPEPTPAPPTQESQPQSVVPKGAESDKPQPAAGCPGPIYQPSDVSQMAIITSEFPPFFTDDAIKNNVEGKIVLQAILCSTGRVANITVENHLPSGLTERAIQILKLVQFQPANLDSKPVAVMWRQEFTCAQFVCRAVK